MQFIHVPMVYCGYKSFLCLFLLVQPLFYSFYYQYIFLKINHDFIHVSLDSNHCAEIFLVVPITQMCELRKNPAGPKTNFKKHLNFKRMLHLTEFQQTCNKLAGRREHRKLS